MCGDEFTADQRRDYMRHAGKCLKRNQERFEEEAHLRDTNAFTGILDKERHRWIRKRAAEGKETNWLIEGISG
jgi:hypothetical protein